jgi:ubiquinol-cytochrome c reductase cytochrome b subunit
LFKDEVNFVALLLMWLVTLSIPDWSADAENFKAADLSNSPLHIQPEWYFLHLYAILRSIPNKLGGLIAFVVALAGPLFLVGVVSTYRLKQLPLFTILGFRFISINLILLWLGMQVVEEPFILIGQLTTVLFFLVLGSILRLDFLLVNIF